MRIFFPIAAFFLVACAIPDNASGDRPPSGSEKTYTDTDKLPPRDIPVDDVTDGERYCGGFTAGPPLSCEEPREYCHREIEDICGAADAPGICRERPQVCPENYAPVCGCDGQTYPNACAANREGVSAMSSGKCR